MTGIPQYSTTPANNINANTGINWDEGMSPSAVNNSARANMADTRTAFNDLIWFQYGGGTSPVVTPVYVGSTQFKVPGVDVSIPYHVGRRVKAVGSGTGTIYGSISAVAFSTDTTVTVVWDSGSLSNEALTIYLSQVPVTGSPVDIRNGSWTPADGSGASLSFTLTGTQRWSKIGKQVTAWFDITYPATISGSSVVISGLPFTSGSERYTGGIGFNNNTKTMTPLIQGPATSFGFQDLAAGTSITNTDMNAHRVNGFVTYLVA